MGSEQIVFSAVSVIVKKPKHMFEKSQHLHTLYAINGFEKSVFSDTPKTRSLCTFEPISAKNSVTSNMLSLDGFCAINFASSTASNVDSLFFAVIMKARNQYRYRGTLSNTGQYRSIIKLSVPPHNSTSFIIIITGILLCMAKVNQYRQICKRISGSFCSYGQVDFFKECRSDEICRPEMQMLLGSETESCCVVVGFATTITIKVDIHNLVHSVNMRVIFPPLLVLIQVVRDYSDESVTCTNVPMESKLNVTARELTCEVDNPIQANFALLYDTINVDKDYVNDTIST